MQPPGTHLLKTFGEPISGPVVLELVCTSEASGGLINIQIEPTEILI